MFGKNIDKEIKDLTYQTVKNLYGVYGDSAVDDIAGECLLYYVKQKNKHFEGFVNKLHFINWYKIKCRFVGVSFLRQNGSYNLRWKNARDHQRAILISSLPKTIVDNIPDEHNGFNLIQYLAEESIKTVKGKSKEAFEYYFLPYKCSDVKDLTSNRRGALMYNVLQRLKPVMKYNLKILKDIGITP